MRFAFGCFALCRLASASNHSRRSGPRSSDRHLIANFMAGSLGYETLGKLRPDAFLSRPGRMTTSRMTRHLRIRNNL